NRRKSRSGHLHCRQPQHRITIISSFRIKLPYDEVQQRRGGANVHRYFIPALVSTMSTKCSRSYWHIHALCTAYELASNQAVPRYLTSLAQEIEICKPEQ